MANKRKSLGRGLGALLGDATRANTAAAPTAANTAASSEPAATSALRELDIDLLQRGRYQPRVDMRKDTLDELAASIKAQGIVQPIAVRPVISAGDTQRFEIIAGERRWRAAQIAGLAKIPAVVHDVSDNEAVAMALIENIQREDLNPLEEARALSRLIEEFDLTHQQGADAVGRSRASVSNLLRLMELGEDVQAMLEQRQLDMGHARALLGIPAGNPQTTLARQVIAQKLSVRDTEKLVRQANKPAVKKPAAKKKDPNITRLEADLTAKLGATVAVGHGSGGRGTLTISYNSLDELDGIIEKIG